jgi:hypothetical protein
MPVRRTILIALLLMPVASQRAAAQTSPPPLRGILVRAAAYVQQFETNFALAVSDETYLQTQMASGLPGGGFQASARRRTESEMLFVWLPHEQLWMTARNVRVVDGKAIPNSEGRLATAFDATDEERIARLRRIRDESARFNLGQIRRNMNEPTFALEFLSARLQPRFRWDLKGRETVNGGESWKVAFEERARPTLVTRDGVNLVSTGTVWINTSSHAVMKTTLVVEDRGLRTRATIDVDYGYEPKLGLRVPTRMTEMYGQLRMPLTAGGSIPLHEDRIECQATYSNYRRFETSGRLVTPPSR